MSLTKDEWKNLKPGDVIIEESPYTTLSFLLVLENPVLGKTWKGNEAVEFTAVETKCYEKNIFVTKIVPVVFACSYSYTRKL